MNDTTDFSAHAAGMTSVMLACGPDAFRSGEMHKIFLACRQYLIYGALCSREASFLGDHQWLSLIPDEDKLAYDRVMDIMTQLPGVRKRFITLQSCSPGTARYVAKRQTLIDHLWHLQAAIADARVESLKHPPQQHYTFANFTDAITLTVYWACAIENYNLLGQSYEAFGISSTSHSIKLTPTTTFTITTFPTTTPPSPPNLSLFAAADHCRALAMTHAKDICSSVHYFTSNNRPNVFALVHIMSPLKMALRCFVLNLPASAEYLAWTHDMLGVLQRTGMGVMEWVMLDRGGY